MRWLCIPALALCLSGCALPAGITLASFAVDAGSFAASGKTLPDHGLSFAMEKDCAMLRLFDQDQEVCQDSEVYETETAALTPLDADDPATAGPWPHGDPRDFAQLTQRVDAARAHWVHPWAHYLAAGMLEPKI